MKKLRRYPNRFQGLTLGMDIHKQFIQYTVLDQLGNEVEADRISSRPDQVLKLIAKLTADGQPIQAVIEACGCFVWVFDLFVEQIGHDHVHVAAPSKVRAIANSTEKNDANDAWWLAYLQFEGLLPKAFVVEGDLRELRIASRELRAVVDERSDLMRRMRSHFAQLGLTFAKSAWASIVGRRRIEALVQDAKAKHGERGEAIARLWQRIQSMDLEVRYWRDRIETLSKSFDQVALLDDTIPGLAVQTAAIVHSELGDPRRYTSAKAYAKATGLTPGYRESGGHRSQGNITRQGSSHVRWALTRAVMACHRCKSGPGVVVTQWVRNQTKRKSKKAAMVAAARKLAEGIWRQQVLGEAFDLERAFGDVGGRSRRKSKRQRANGGSSAQNPAGGQVMMT